MYSLVPPHASSSLASIPHPPPPPSYLLLPLFTLFCVSLPPLSSLLLSLILTIIIPTSLHTSSYLPPTLSLFMRLCSHFPYLCPHPHFSPYVSIPFSDPHWASTCNGSVCLYDKMPERPFLFIFYYHYGTISHQNDTENRFLRLKRNRDWREDGWAGERGRGLGR